MTVEEAMRLEVFMTASVTPLKLVTQYPPPAVLPRQTTVQQTRPRLPDFSNVPHADFEAFIDLIEKNSDAAQREISRLRFENKRLEDELEGARMHPMHDESFDRINVQHDLWLRQTRDLLRLHEFKTRYYVVVSILFVILLKSLFTLFIPLF